jgi:N-acetylneuraminic acid mutarotase
VFSFLGLDASKTWSGVTNAANRWDVGTDSWTPIDPVPGPGRFASTAQVVAGLIYVIGGYDGVPSQPIRQVLSYAPLTGEWRQLAAPPIASMDHRNLGEAGGWDFLVGGMHEDQVVTDNVWYTTVSALLTRVF